MISTCQNCQKEYEAKRRGGKFCSAACRVSAWEKAQPLPSAVGEHLQEQATHEEYLARKIVSYGEEASTLLSRLNSKTEPKADPAKLYVDMVKILEGLQWELSNSVVQEVLKRRAFIPN
jgi:hypothetical protein